jgi:hypothetical protein
MAFFARTEFDNELVEMLRAASKPAQFAARNAVRHIDKADTIAESDPEMAALRGITAEEESATAVFHALKRHKYPGSEALRLRDHVQKNALNPFCLAVAELFGHVDRVLGLKPQLRINDEGEAPVLITQFHVSNIGLGERLAMPQPPLNLAVSKGDQLHDFSEQIQNLATSRRAQSIHSHLRKRANLRNEILYASAQGLPNVKLNRFLHEQRRAVKVNIELFLLIDPYSEHQLFVAQTLRAFLKMLDQLPPDLAF